MHVQILINIFLIRYRSRRSRKNSRVNNLTDVFKRTIHSSDPLIIEKLIPFRLSNRKAESFSNDVMNLLCPPELWNIIYVKLIFIALLHFHNEIQFWNRRMDISVICIIESGKL